MTRTTRRARRNRRIRNIRNVLNATYITFSIIFFAWLIVSLIEVWNHGYASFDGTGHVYSNFNLFKLLFGL